MAKIRSNRRWQFYKMEGSDKVVKRKQRNKGKGRRSTTIKQKPRRQYRDSSGMFTN